MTDPALLILESLLQTYSIVDIVQANFMRTPDPADLVRRSEVAKVVAERLNVDDSPTLRRRVAQACADIGFSRVNKTGGIVAYRYMKRRGQR